MDIQFEINGEVVAADNLAATLGSPAAEAMIRLAERIAEAHGEIVCEVHQQSPAVVVVMSAMRGMGVRVSGCCQHQIDHLQDVAQKIMLHTARLTMQDIADVTLIVRVAGTDKAYEFVGERLEQVMIGRLDPNTGEHPEIDLSAYGAYENGVSRRHAAIITWNRSLYIVDQGSPNGTFLNGNRLPPNEPGPLKYGDQIRIGRLVLDVTLDYAQEVAAS